MALTFFLDQVRPFAEHKFPSLLDKLSYLFCSLRAEGRPLNCADALQNVSQRVCGVHMGCNAYRALLSTEMLDKYLRGEIDERQAQAVRDVSHILFVICYFCFLFIFYTIIPIGEWSRPRHGGEALQNSANSRVCKIWSRNRGHDRSYVAFFPAITIADASAHIEWYARCFSYSGQISSYQSQS